jgi:hypothetical protein
MLILGLFVRLDIPQLCSASVVDNRRVVEELIPTKFAKIKSRQDAALETTFSVS